MTISRLMAKILFACTSIALAFALAGCVREPESPLRIGSNVWIGGEPLYLARELGALDAGAVQLVEYPSASEVLRAFRNQAIDGMVISLDEMLTLAADGLDPRIIVVIDISHGADAVLGRAYMRSMQDLRDRPVAVEGGALGAYMLSRALTLSGMQASDVRVIHLESNEQPAAFENGQVDGAVTFDPYRGQLIRAGARTLFDSTHIPGEIVDVIAVRASVLGSHPHAIRGLLAGWFSATAYMVREPVDAARRMAIRQQTTGEQFLSALGGLRIPTYEENLKLLAGGKPDLPVAARRLMDLMLEARLLRSAVDIDELLAPRPLEEMHR